LLGSACAARLYANDEDNRRSISGRLGADLDRSIFTRHWFVKIHAESSGCDRLAEASRWKRRNLIAFSASV
jgi:hypothetical protein